PKTHDFIVAPHRTFRSPRVTTCFVRQCTHRSMISVLSESISLRLVVPPRVQFHSAVTAVTVMLQCAPRAAASCWRARRRSGSRRERLDGHVAELVVELEHQALGLLAADAAHAAQRVQVAALYAAHRSLGAECGEQREREPGPESARAAQPPEDLPLHRALES